ncbi:Ribokinase [Geobacillus stearothermophilus]|nr:Ribokinase [Geobacillus stearothermophilus]
MARPSITVIGSLNMDLVTVAARFPNQGETILGEQFLTTPGGKGANQAVAAARLGADVRMIGAVGMMRLVKSSSVRCKMKTFPSIV